MKKNTQYEYALEIRVDDRWDYYPDPLRETGEQVWQKINYLTSKTPILYRSYRNYRCRRLSPAEQEEHYKQFMKFCGNREEV